MDLMKYTKAELAALLRSRNEEVEALRLNAVKLVGTITALRAKHERSFTLPGAPRYWDEFATRKEALDWAKANPMCALKQRPAQRTEA